MGVSSGRSRVTDVTFQVFNRTLHPDWFSTKEFRRVEQLGWEADLRIIEAGHAVIFRSGSIRLTEILCGPETTLPENGVLFRSHLRRERSTILRPGGMIEYQSCLAVEHVDLEIFNHLCDEVRWTDAQLLVPPLRVVQPPGPGADQPHSHHSASQRPIDPVVSHVSRRVRDCPDAVVIRRESARQSALMLRRGNKVPLEREASQSPQGDARIICGLGSRFFFHPSIRALAETRWRVDGGDADL